MNFYNINILSINIKMTHIGKFLTIVSKTPNTTTIHKIDLYNQNVMFLDNFNLPNNYNNDSDNNDSDNVISCSITPFYGKDSTIIRKSTCKFANNSNIFNTISTFELQITLVDEKEELEKKKKKILHITQIKKKNVNENINVSNISKKWYSKNVNKNWRNVNNWKRWKM